MNLNSDWTDLLECFVRSKVRFLVVGAHARAQYTRPRTTGDMDVWVEPNSENAARVFRALVEFGAPLQGVSAADFERCDTIYQIGVPPVRIDVITEIDGVTFVQAWPNRHEGSLGGVDVCFIGRDDFLKNKRAAGRPKDLGDIAAVEDEPL